MKKKKHDQLHKHASNHDTPFQQIVKYMIEHVRLQGFPGCPGGMLSVPGEYLKIYVRVQISNI